MTAWALPDHLADVLPTEAHHIEILRRSLLDTAGRFGCQLVMPPLLEHAPSKIQDLQTFKLIDQLSGRTLALRADTTPQVARIDAHLLHEAGVTRLMYCNSVLHTLPHRPKASREPLQFGAEIYGHAGVEADAEAIQMALDCLGAANVCGVTLCLSSVKVLQVLFGENHPKQDAIFSALATKDAKTLKNVLQSSGATPKLQEDAQTLLSLYGDANQSLDAARNHLHAAKLGASTHLNMHMALNDLQAIADSIDKTNSIINTAIVFDLADAGTGYGGIMSEKNALGYNGIRFSIYHPKALDALVKGGRYDNIGAEFGRKRPAVGFSLDVKDLTEVTSVSTQHRAVFAPFGTPVEFVAQLRHNGEHVVSGLSIHDTPNAQCDRTCVATTQNWCVIAL